MNTLTIKTKESNPFKLQKKGKLIEELAQLDNEILERLIQLKKSKKAIEMVSNTDSWQSIKDFLM